MHLRPTHLQTLDLSQTRPSAPATWSRTVRNTVFGMLALLGILGMLGTIYFLAQNANHYAEAAAAGFLVFLLATATGIALLVTRTQTERRLAVAGERERGAAEISALFADSLRESEERLRLALDTARLYVVEWDVLREAFRGDAQAAKLWGGVVEADTWIPSKSAERQAIVERVHPQDRARHEADIRSVLEGRAASYRTHYRYRRTDGEWAWIEAQGTVVQRDAGSGRPLRFISIGRDLTEQRAAEATLRWQNRHLGLLAQMTSQLLAGDLTDAMLEGIFADLAKMLGAEFHFYYVPDSDLPQTLRLKSTEGLDEAAQAQFAQADFGSTLCGMVAQDQTAIVRENLQSCTDAVTASERAVGMQAYACHPLAARGRLIGTLAFASSTRALFSAGEVALMRTACDQIAAATDRAQLAKQSRESEARLNLVQQIGRIANFDWTLSEPSAVVSDEYLRLYGLPPGQERILTEEWRALIHEEDRERVSAEIRVLIADDGGTLATEFRARHTDGSIRWVAMRAQTYAGPGGHPVRMVGAQQDVTEVMAAREAMASRQEELERQVAQRTAALAAAEARFRAIFDAQFEFIGLLSPDGTTLEANRAALEAGGLNREDVVGRPFWEMTWWPPGERDWLPAAVAAAAAGKFVRREAEAIGAGGRRIRIDFSLKPVRDPVTGTVDLIIPEGRDVTERRNLEKQLIQAQKIQALGQLAGGIAHDFNNILQVVSGATALMEHRPGDREKVRRLARVAQDAAARGMSITRRLLSFARSEELRAEPVATDELIDNVREVLAHTLGSPITIRAAVPRGIPPLLADRSQLETALVNLGTNARDAMPGGGTLTLAATADSVAENARHPAGLRPGDYLRIAVTDTGVGMDAATAARVTEPFFTTKPQGQGTGLGLPMVKGFVDQSGGGLTIESAPGLGTTVTLWLPQVDSVATPVRGAPPIERTTGNRPPTARVLVVDDDDLVRETLAEQLEALGFATLVACGGTEALALLDSGEPVDAVISDHLMPDMSGVETIAKARERRPGLLCFLLTGYMDDRAALSGHGAFQMLRKPVGGKALATRIRAGLAGSQSAGE